MKSSATKLILTLSMLSLCIEANIELVNKFADILDLTQVFNLLITLKDRYALADESAIVLYISKSLRTFGAFILFDCLDAIMSQSVVNEVTSDICISLSSLKSFRSIGNSRSSLNRHSVLMYFWNICVSLTDWLRLCSQILKGHLQYLLRASDHLDRIFL